MALLQNVIASGTHAARPGAGSAGILYFETDTGRLYRDNGTSWDALDVFTTAGDLLYFDGANKKRLAVGSSGQLLTVSSGEPAWTTPTRDIVQLNYVANTDLANALAVSASTWTDIGTNQSFSVASASSLVEIHVGGAILVGTSATELGARLVIDSAGTPIVVFLGGGYIPASYFANALAGASMVPLSGLSAGTHTAKVQIYSGLTSTAYCRPASTSNQEGLRICVIEREH